MATQAPALTPPPETDGSQSAPPSAPTSASPSPATPAPMTDAVSKTVIDVVHGLRAIAKSIPATSPVVAEINELIRSKLMPALMISQQPSEPAAPPMGG